MGEWHHYRLGELGETYTGLTGKTKDDFGSGKPFIPYKNIFYNATINPEWLDYVQVSEGERQYRVQYGDIFFTTSSETPDEVGMSSVLLDDLGECYLNSFCFGFRLHDFSVLLPQYARYLFRGEDFRRQMYALSQGSTRFNLSKRELLKSELVLPPLAEQKKIAEILSTWDEAIALTEQLIDALGRRKKGLMQRLLLVPAGMEHPQVRFPDFTERWEVYEFGQVFERVTRKNDNGCDNVLTASAEFGLISQTEYYNRSVAGASLENYYLLHQGEFAYNRSSADGYPYGALKRLERYEEGVVSTLYICFRLAEENFDPVFFKHFFEAGGMDRALYQIVQEGARSHGLLNVSLSDFFSLQIHTPSPEEQHALAEFFDLVDKEIQLARQRLEALKRQKKGLMQRLLTGQVRVKV